MKNLGAFITKKRESKGLSIRALGDKSDITFSAISRLESGRPTRASTLSKILGGLGITPGSPDHIEAFALFTADSSINGEMTLTPALGKRIAAGRSARTSHDEAVLAQYNSLTNEQRNALDFLLANPRAINAIADLHTAYAAKPARGARSR